MGVKVFMLVNLNYHMSGFHRSKFIGMTFS